MDRELRAIEFEALAIESQIICIEAQGMKYENESCMYLGQDVAYHEGSFQEKAEQLQSIAQKIRDLAKL